MQKFVSWWNDGDDQYDDNNEDDYLYGTMMMV